MLPGHAVPVVVVGKWAGRAGERYPGKVCADVGKITQDGFVTCSTMTLDEGVTVLNRLHADKVQRQSHLTSYETQSGRNRNGLQSTIWSYSV